MSFYFPSGKPRTAHSWFSLVFLKLDILIGPFATIPWFSREFRGCVDLIGRIIVKRIYQARPHDKIVYWKRNSCEKREAVRGKFGKWVY